MKRKILGMFAAILFCGTMNVQAQYYDHKHEIGISIGRWANTQIIGALSDITEIAVDAAISTSITGGNVAAYYTYSDKNVIPAFSVEYYYRLSKVVGIGGFLAFNNLNRDMYYNVTYTQTNKTEQVKDGNAKRTNFSVIPTVKLDWLRTKNFGMYSKLGVGLSMMHEKQTSDKKGEIFNETDYGVNFQASLLGIEAGLPNLRAFLEWGVGEQGIGVLGVRYKF